MNIDELSHLGNLADLIQTGFASKDISYSESLSQLHKWLLDQCSSTYMHRYLQGGLQHWSRKWEYPYILSNVAKYCTSVNVRPHVLDNACGVNATAYLLAKAGLNITGTDLNEQASAEGHLPSEAWSHPDTKNLEGKMSFLKADSLSLPFDKDSFDIAFSISSLEHMSDPIEALKEMLRVTKKGGLVTFTMDVAPYSRAIKGENNVNTGNFHAFQEVLLTNTEFFSPPKFQIPSNLLSWQNDCKTSSGLRDLISSQLRKFKGLPISPNFYVFGGVYIKR